MFRLKTSKLYTYLGYFIHFKPATCNSSHEVAETQGLLTYAFGTDGVDRYVRVYRKENPPCEDELAARRRGEPWNEQIKQQLLEKVYAT